MLYLYFQEGYIKVMAIDTHKKSFIINSLRRATYRWPGRWLAEKRAKLARNEYYCENEDCGVIGPKRMFQMDHHIPVVLVEGWDSWEGVLDRMFCSPEGFRRICRDCHKVKTAAENRLRPKPAKKPRKTKKKT